jgi:hypothetical protein
LKVNAADLEGRGGFTEKKKKNLTSLPFSPHTLIF